jgi:hypothetical protein
MRHHTVVAFGRQVTTMSSKASEAGTMEIDFSALFALERVSIKGRNWSTLAKALPNDSNIE